MQVPAEQYPFYHATPIQMRFNDIDILGHVNNSIYMQYMDLAKVLYFTDVLGDAMNFKREALVIVNLNCEFYNISVFDEHLEALTQVTAIGERSITIEQRILNPDTHQVKCICRTVMVGFSIVADESMVIPDSWRSLISAFEHRPL